MNFDGVAYSAAGLPKPQWFEQTKGKLELVRGSVLTRTPGGVGSPFRSPYEVSPTEGWDRNRTFLNPFPQLGMLNSQDWLTLTRLHVMRHAKQVIEVQEDPNYPGRAVAGGQ